MVVWPRVWYGRSVVRPHQGSLSGEAWFRAHVCVAADEAGKKKNRTRGKLRKQMGNRTGKDEDEIYSNIFVDTCG